MKDFYFLGDDYRYHIDFKAKHRFLELLKERFNSGVTLNVGTYTISVYGDFVNEGDISPENAPSHWGCGLYTTIKIPIKTVRERLHRAKFDIKLSNADIIDIQEKLSWRVCVRKCNVCE